LFTVGKAPKGRNMNSPGQVQRSGTQPGEARCPALHSRGARTFHDAPVLRRAKGRETHCSPALRTGLFTLRPFGAF
ncbi:MAG: hypothetical protein LBG31_05795, partial [Prevotellaceae bacterium]|nr:hypothetical protein [Prevotellaceae bacterium]